MNDDTFKWLAIALYFLGMLMIGYYGYKRTTTGEDYMLGGRALRPGVAALSAGASDMSGWLMLGLPGAIFVAGLDQAWIAVGLVVGAWLNWKFVAHRLRSYTEVSNNSITVPSFFENRLRDRSRLLRIVAGLIILVFFTFYVSSGMVAAGTFFQGAFGASYFTGMLLVAGITLAYTMFGGFTGVAWTDVVQGLMSMVALIVLPAMAIAAMGGFGESLDAIAAVDASATSWIAGASFVGVVSAAAWGLGYFGQPHIIVRFMALRSAKDAVAGRRIGISWMVLSTGGAVLLALLAIGYLPTQGINLAEEEAETVLLRMADVLFHPFIAGIILAAVLAAIMSTISSQLLVCSSALVEDLYKVVLKRTASEKAMVLLGRLGVLVVAVVAAVIALDPGGTVLGLVAFAWAGFGAAFGPIIILSLYWRRLSAWGALAGMATGAVVVVVWAQTGLGESLIYEIVPGFVACALVAVLVSLATARPNEEIDNEFEAALKQADAWKEPEPTA
ncbi:sodium/proline symporter PutP [Ruania halotolerans]|uniref:sodium/proline symporter PutP n=1 Tax=Ruania halotolerans TaxID=2897773 RepID=UPI001E4240FB|nr:sodium/proline symporter PutP [Ruania halotolerans]UFU08125.1 sodium/proline symporter PutP [Ruania halotolerans]